MRTKKPLRNAAVAVLATVFGMALVLLLLQCDTGPAEAIVCGIVSLIILAVGCLLTLVFVFDSQ